jgi:hypothetical protein
LEATLSASEWLDWQRFAAVEPFGAPMLDVVQAQLRALLAEIHRDAGVRREPFEPRDFLLFQTPPSETLQQATHGLSAADWRLAMYLKALQARQQSTESPTAGDPATP